MIGASMEISQAMNDIDAVLSNKPISPSREMAAYEALWAHQKATFKTIADAYDALLGRLRVHFLRPVLVSTAAK